MTEKSNDHEISLNKKIANIIDIFFERHPEATISGFLLGYFLHVMVKLFTPTLDNYLKFIDFKAVSLSDWILVGMFLTYVPTIIFLIIKKPEVEEAEKIKF
jgi:hypothetical protein